MMALIGHYSITLAFIASIISLVFYLKAANSNSIKIERIASLFFILKGLFILLASGILMNFLLTNQFQYYYVFNYTSSDLQLKYLIAAFYSGQEGSVLLWIIMSFFVGLGLLKWTSKVYRASMMFFFTLTQFFLVSMVLGVELFDIKLGSSPFRTLQSEMPNAPIFMSNPDFIPQEGSGLNDLLRSPWIVIHPPVLFLGFAMMTVPYAFALAALWKRQYQNWIYPSLPWALGANLSLLTAIFLGGYWAYETLSFGGYWAWDPVENASLVPWIVGTAGIHTMLVQRKSATAAKSSIIFAVLAYILIVYETFLTRSGVLGEASVHSFVDLGLYNQLLIFMLTVLVLGAGFIMWRYKELPSKLSDEPILSREFLMFFGAMALFLSGLVIIIGTSSPILGRLFVSNPTPPEMAFYNNWSLPFAIIIAVLTVIGQFVWWKKVSSTEQLASFLVLPTLLASIFTVTIVIIGDIRVLAYMIYLFAALFALFGNAIILSGIIVRKPAMIGGTLTHVGFAVLLAGILGAAYDTPLLDDDTYNYNQAVLRGEVYDNEGFPVIQGVEMVELHKDVPKLLGNRYLVTYLDAEITERNRPGEQEYTLQIIDTKGRTDSYFLTPTVYPMIANSSAGSLNWTVDPAVKTGIFSDLYAYVAGSSLVERENNRMSGSSDDLISKMNNQELPEPKIIRLKKETSAVIDHFKIIFNDFKMLDASQYPDGATIAVKATIMVVNEDTRESRVIEPLFAIIRENDSTSYTYSPATALWNDESFVQFTNVNPSNGEIELQFTGIDTIEESEWILLTGEKKPFVSLVWLGTFLLMSGFSVAIIRRWSDQKRREKHEK